MTANLITSVRLVCAVIMVFCPTFSGRFYALYIVGGVSDVLDGLAARRLGQATKLGARLDTAADAAFLGVVIVKTLRAVEPPLWIVLWIVGIAVVKCAACGIGLIRFGRFLTEHTVMNRICGALVLAVPPCAGLLPRQAAGAVILLSCAAATAAAVQEAVYILNGREIV